MGICLWDRLRKAHLKLVAAQRYLLIVCDEVIEGVEDKVICQEELRSPSILPGVDTAVLNFPIPPEERQDETGMKNRSELQRIRN